MEAPLTPVSGDTMPNYHVSSLLAYRPPDKQLTSINF